MRRNNRVKERTFDSSAKRALCARETPILKNFCKNGQMGMNFRVFLRLDRWYRQVLCANSFTILAELSLHRAGKPALNYLVAEDRERVKGGEAACEALDVNSVFCYQPASSSCISMYFMLMYFFPPHWVPAT